ncbi:putative integral membrane protein (TIGR02327 family) [Paenibacillus turicensis]|uniref:Integral membrane protein (TIGR02327 family) n=2 Tax=Paenibacillus turicensis TaxID=160487 RepID=A0ABS4FWW5_9BACL|nr:putative integral membrane protein (TIGR02327 family) [Paenibacillus turicensis]
MEMRDTFQGMAGISGLTAIIVSLICIGLSWWAMQNVKWELFIRHPQGAQGKLLQLLFAIIIGHFVAAFVIDYLSYTIMLRYMF